VAAATIIMMAVHSHGRQGQGDAGVGSLVASQASPSNELGAGDRHDEQSVLVAPATVRTAPGEILNLSLRGGTAVTLNSESILSLDRDDQPTVAAGDVRFRVPHQPPGQRFVVAAQGYRVVVVGTRFGVQVTDATAAPRVHVNVEEGVVQVWRAGGDAPLAVLHAGEDWTAPTATAAGDSGATKQDLRHPDAVAGEESRRSAPGSKLRAAAGIQSRVSAHPLDPRAHGRRHDDLTAGQSGSGTDHAAALTLALGSPGDNATASLAPSGTSRFGNDDDGAGAALEPSGAGPEPLVTRPSVPSARVASPPPAPEVAALLSQAKVARAAGERHKALGLYRKLVENGGPVGEDAAYEMGRLYRDELSQPREAIATWRLYRARNPRGLLRIEADLSIIETLMALDDKSGALSEASDFIRRYPEGERHPEMARLVGDLSRERGECQAAIDAYDEVLGDARARGAILDEVTFHRAICLLRKSPGAGADAIRAYVQKFPHGRYRTQAQRLMGGAPLEPGGAAPN
jgi:tetratricopeptide (TPR) repeat protein